MSCMTSVILGRASGEHVNSFPIDIDKTGLTFGEEVLDDLGSLLVHLVERALDFARDALDLGSVPTSVRLEQARVLLRDLLDDLDEAGIAADRVTVELAHVRATRESC